MKHPSEKTTDVRILAGDGLAEISIVDNQFNEIDSGLGYLSTKLAPGIYKVRWTIGSSVEDKLIEITGDEGDDGLTIEARMPVINTSAPLNNTKFGSIDRPEVLRTLSAGVPTFHADKACQILVFLRDPVEVRSKFPANSVAIHSSSGAKIASLTDSLVNTAERYAGILVGVDPGVYRLRVETGPRGSYEVFVFAAEGWQTRVFLACEDFYYGTETFRRPALRTMSVLLGRVGQTFDPDSRDARLAELALRALLQGQDVLESDDMQGLLYGKFEDPMLGIYGAHLLLQRKPVKWELFNTVCRNLRRLVGPIPDVQALEARLSRKIHDDNDGAEWRLYLGMPPMLIRSWDLLVKQSRRRFSTIPSGSLSDKISGSVVSTKPWLMCRVASEATTDVIPTKPVSVAKAKRVVQQMIDQVSAADSEGIQAYLDEMQEGLDPIERAILDVVALTESPERSGDSSKAQKYDVSGFESSDISHQLRKIAIADSTVPQIQAPSYSIARSAVTLASKLSGKFDFDMS